VFKNTNIRENKVLQFRLEMFNAFNHVNLGNPNNDSSDLAHFGTITYAGAPREIQFGLKFLY
jgi:hypothetical protein